MIHLALWLVSACFIVFFAMCVLAAIANLIGRLFSEIAKPFQPNPKPLLSTAPQPPQLSSVSINEETSEDVPVRLAQLQTAANAHQQREVPQEKDTTAENAPDGLLQLQAAIITYQREQVLKQENARRQAEEAAAAQRRHTEGKALIESLWLEHLGRVHSCISAVNQVLNDVGFGIVGPTSATWHHEAHVDADAGEIDEDEWFGIICPITGLGAEVVIALQEEYFEIWVDSLDRQEVWLEGISDQAIVDTVASLLIPLIEEKRQGEAT